MVVLHQFVRYKLFNPKGSCMKRNSSGAFLNIMLLVAAIVVLPGCSPVEWFKEKFGACDGSCSHGEGDVIATSNGKVILSSHDFEKKLVLLYKSRPGIEQALTQMPAEQREQIMLQIADGIVAEKLIKDDVTEKGLDKTPEYKENIKQGYEAVQEQALLHAYQNDILKELEADMTDDKVLAYYNENCSKQPIFKQHPFLISAAGIKAALVEVGSEREAHEIAVKAKAKGLHVAAKESKKTHKELGVVHSKSHEVDEAIRTKLEQAKSFPSVHIVKQKSGKYAVVEAQAQQAEEYAKCEVVKDHVKQIMNQEKFAQLYNQRIAALKEKHNIVINKEYFGSKEAVAVEAEAAAEAPEATPAA